jgi:glycosyltransferase involved in cell wall biosynthesis
MSRADATPEGSALPLISAVICTYNRAELLRGMLESLSRQSIDRAAYEVVVVDDGSTDDTRAVVEAFEQRVSLTYGYQRNSGLASARNHGVFLSRAPVVLFLDDDDIASRELLDQHLRTHRTFPADRYAVLGYTCLAPDLAADPLMRFVTEVGQFLFSYVGLQDGAELDFSYFWGGRSSCKRALLLEHGVFNSIFRFGCEDIELAYRLSKIGFRVVYNAHAASTTVRKIGLDQFCERLVAQGRSNFVFSRLHPEEEVRRWAEVIEAERAWPDIAPVYEALLHSARELDRMARLKGELGFQLEASETECVHRAYWLACRAAKFKGIEEARRRPG